MCNVPIELNGDVLVAYLSAYDSVEVLPARLAAGTAHGDFIINMFINREVFQAIPHIIAYKDQNMMLVIEGRRPLCWVYKQIGHFVRSCPQKTAKPTATTSATSPSKSDLEPGDHPDKEEGWILVICQKTTTEATTAKATAAVTSKSPALTESSPVN